MPVAYIIRETIIVETNCDYCMYATLDDEMIPRMLCLPPDKNRLHNMHSAQSVKEHTAEYTIDNRSVDDILDHIYKITDLIPYVKHHKSNRDSRGVIYAIHSRWLGRNHANMTASEAELVLQMSVYDGEKIA